MTLDALIVPDRFIGNRVRTFWPAEALRREGYAVKVIRNERMYLDSPKLKASKVLMIHRNKPGTLLDLVAWGRGQGMRVIVSVDDALWQFRGGSWADYEVAAMVAGARAADRVIVSTSYLAELYGRWNPNVRVIPNYLPAWVWGVEPARDSLARRGSGPPVVGWRGDISGHVRDVRWLADGGNLRRLVGRGSLRVVGNLRQTIEQNADVLFEGNASPSVGVVETVLADFALGDLLPRHWSQTGWIKDARRMYEEMAACDLAVVPLDPAARFNEAKSWLAAVEWLACGVPVIASPTRENLALADAIGNLRTMLVADDPADVARYPFTHSTPTRCRDDVRPFQLERHIDEWAEALFG